MFKIVGFEINKEIRNFSFESLPSNFRLQNTGYTASTKGRLLGFARFRPERNSIVRIEVAIGESPGKMVAGPSGKILSSALSLSRDKLKRAFSSLIRVLRQPPCVPFFQPLCPAELTLPPSRFSREETTRSSPLHR